MNPYLTLVIFSSFSRQEFAIHPLMRNSSTKYVRKAAIGMLEVISMNIKNRIMIVWIS